MSIIAYLQSWLYEAISKTTYQGIKKSEIVVTINHHPLVFGDYSTVIALQIAKKRRQNPQIIAKNIINNLAVDPNIIKVSIAKPAFMNIYVTPIIFDNMVSKIIALKEDYGRFKMLKPVKYNIEYVSANPTGLLHLGHARNAAIGSVIANVLKFRGYSVIQEYYINDAGKQIETLALSVYIKYQNLCGNNLQPPIDGYQGKEITSVATALKEQVNDKYSLVPFTEVQKVFANFAVNYMLAEIKTDLKNYKVEINNWFSENSLYNSEKINNVINILQASSNLCEKDGAIWLRTTKFGDDKDRVIVKSDRSYTYLLPDLAYHYDKWQRSDYLLNIWGADHVGYLPRLKSGSALLDPNISKRLKVIFVQMVRLFRDGKEEKMSKRSGAVITLREMLEEFGCDVLRYFMISRSSGSHLDIDITLLSSTDKNKNPVFYLQYAYARICQLLQQAPSFVMATSFSLLNHEKEKQLLIALDEYELVLVRVVEHLEPHLLVIYLQKLAKLFHSYYNECRIINESNQILMIQRLTLVSAVQIVIYNCLSLIGLSAPTKM